MKRACAGLSPRCAVEDRAGGLFAGHRQLAGIEAAGRANMLFMLGEAIKAIFTQVLIIWVQEIVWVRTS